METYKCAYRDPHSPLTPLTPICDTSLRRTLRDHSPSLMPIPKIILADCPPPKRRRSETASMRNNFDIATPANSPCNVNIFVSSERTPPGQAEIGRSSYLQHLRRMLTPTSRQRRKSMDFAPTCVTVSPVKKKTSKFTCFPKSPRLSQLPMSPRVLRILQDIGQERYTDLFRNEEIDLEVFKILTRSDLVKLGIKEERDLPDILNAIQLVKNW